MDLTVYSDLRPWQYYVDFCGMKQSSIDLIMRSVEFARMHGGRI